MTWLTSKLIDVHATDKYKEILTRFKDLLNQGLGSKGLATNDELSFLYRKHRIILKLNDKKIGTISPTPPPKQPTPPKSSSSPLQEKPVRFPHIAEHYPWLHEFITTKIFHDTSFHENYGNGVKAIQRLKQRLMDVYAGEASVAPELHQVLKDKFLTGRGRSL